MVVHYHFLKKLVAISLIITVSFYVTVTNHVITRVYYMINPTKSIDCYRDAHRPSLPDISDSDLTPRKKIFFHETSCNSFHEKKLFLYPRQACAVESAARLHPEFDVFLLFTSPGIFKDNGTESDRILQALATYENVKLRRIDFRKYSAGTPVEDLYKNQELQVSRYAQSHSSDVLRYLTLWKYGGIYLDLDVVVIKSLDDLPENFAGSESDRNVAAGVLGFGPSGRGHDFAGMCLNDLKDNFNGNEWGYNGPGVITRLLRKICERDYAKDMVLMGDCDGFKVFPPNSFYPIRWEDWAMYFDEIRTEEVMKLSKLSYAIHVWNMHSVDAKVSVRSNAAYPLFAQKYCPKVFNECKEFF